MAFGLSSVPLASLRFRAAVDLDLGLEEVMTRNFEFLDALLTQVPSGSSCHASCSACCRQSTILIDPNEAALLANITGHPLVSLPVVSVPPVSYQGIPCPFLDLSSNLCTVYAHRPFACRSSVSFDAPVKCETEVFRQMLLPSSISDIYRQILAPYGSYADRFNRLTPGHAADIRAFFP